MSLANYLNRNKIITTEQIELTQEPNELGDGARVSDTIVYKGNATYSLNPPTTTIVGANEDFTPLFYDANGLTPPVADYLNVRPQVDLFNFQQLATINYSVFVNSHSTFDFEYRIAFYNDDLERISAYDPIVYDPSNNAKDPPSIDGFTITGWSVVIPNSARYAFLEVKNNTSGSIELQFDYGNSQLENAVDNSQIDNLLGSRPSTNIFTSDYYVAIRDISGVERDLTIIEAEISQLQNDVSGIEVEIEDISNGYLKLSGGTITGELIVESTVLANELNTKGSIVLEDTNGNAKGRITQTDGKFYLQSGNGDNLIRFSGYEQALKVVDIDTTNMILDTDAVAIKTTDYPDLNAQVKTNENQIGTNTGDISGLIGSVAQKLPLSGGTMTGSINLSGTNRIQNSASPVGIGDLTNKQYVDNAIANIPAPLSFPFSNNKIGFLIPFPINPNPNQNVICNLPADFDHTKNYVSFRFGASASLSQNNQEIKIDLKYKNNGNIQNPLTVFSNKAGNSIFFKSYYIKDIYFNTSNPSSTNDVAKAFSIELSNTSSPASAVTDLYYYVNYTIERVSTTFDISTLLVGSQLVGYTNVALIQQGGVSLSAPPPQLGLQEPTNYTKEEVNNLVVPVYDYLEELSQVQQLITDDGSIQGFPFSFNRPTI